ncbi:MAG: hypothetical protein GF350_14880 [Chitinivibrionales bacterium]|nr:hypothetical protein [Chitinivibrionales bacterium]
MHAPPLRFFLYLLIVTCALRAVDRSEEEQFVTEIEEQYRSEYSLCTGDNRDVNLEIILMWKKQMNTWIESVEYGSILRHYRDSTGDTSQTVIPCTVYHWLRKREEHKRKAEEAVIRDSLRREKEIAESLAVVRDLQKNPSSPFDLIGIPFGVDKKTFVYIFARKYDYSIVEAPDCILVNDFAWESKSFPTTFCFDKNGRYVRLEIESMHYPADSLDTAVRRDAHFMETMLSHKIGQPDHIHRVGLFDIKEDRPEQYREWGTGPYTACIYLATKLYLYNAVTVIARGPRK